MSIACLEGDVGVEVGKNARQLYQRRPAKVKNARSGLPCQLVIAGTLPKSASVEYNDWHVEFHTD